MSEQEPPVSIIRKNLSWVQSSCFEANIWQEVPCKKSCTLKYKLCPHSGLIGLECDKTSCKPIRGQDIYAVTHWGGYIESGQIFHNFQSFRLKARTCWGMSLTIAQQTSAPTSLINVSPYRYGNGDTCSRDRLVAVTPVDQDTTSTDGLVQQSTGERQGWKILSLGWSRQR